MADKIMTSLDVPEYSVAPSSPGSGFHRLYAKTDGKIYGKNSAGTELNLSVGFVSVTKTLTTGAWSLVSGLYEQDVADAAITASSIVDIIPDNADIATVKTAEILPRTESGSGTVKVFSTNLPGANIGVTLNIFK